MKLLVAILFALALLFGALIWETGAQRRQAARICRSTNETRLVMRDVLSAARAVRRRTTQGAERERWERFYAHAFTLSAPVHC